MAIESQDRYDAQPIRCHACAARQRAAQGFKADADNNLADLAGIQFAITERS